MKTIDTPHEVIESVITCDKCEGSGRSLPWIPKEEFPCSKCNGTGKITMQEHFQEEDHIRDMDGGSTVDITR